MPRTSKTPVETVEHYRGKTMRLLSCVTSVHVVSAYRLSDAPHELELADTAKMRGGPLDRRMCDRHELAKC
ncbi:MAG TPA: hypothetical protein VGP18_04845 [Solirubrobacteraceae bacterium]|jgi:hypothetical protein|nr:hypothetical protein [Solirubrobacteraceae bacterium]